MVDVVHLTLRWLHIFFGIAWLGALAFGVMVLRGLTPRLGMATRKELMQRLLPAMFRYVPMMAILTIVFGFALYLYMGQFNPALLVGILWGQLLLAALALALLMLGVGLGVGMRAGRALLIHLQEEQEQHPQEVAALQKRFSGAQLVAFVLGLVVLALMVLATAG